MKGILNMLYGGIDPGKTGAMALIGNERAKVYDYGHKGVLEVLRGLTWNESVFFFIERQQAYPKQGASSGFKLGTNYGEWIGYLKALNYDYAIVDPKKWQNYFFGLHNVNVSNTKKASLEIARVNFPEMGSMLKHKKDHGRSDALLIAEYCRLVHSGEVIP